jgi:hypothetical protein
LLLPRQVILTSGATAALKLAGEAFPWTRGSSCALLNINHNSALGVCRLAAAAGAAVDTVPVDQLLMQRQQQQQQQQTQLQPAGNMRQQQQQPVHSLFVVPAECNFSGTKYDCGQLLHTWQQVCAARHSKQQQQQQQQQAPQLQQWLLLVDAAKACASHPTDLSACPADMLALSYYKVFGHPTGEVPATSPSSSSSSSKQACHPCRTQLPPRRGRELCPPIQHTRVHATCGGAAQAWGRWWCGAACCRCCRSTRPTLAEAPWR